VRIRKTTARSPEGREQEIVWLSGSKRVGHHAGQKRSRANSQRPRDRPDRNQENAKPAPIMLYSPEYLKCGLWDRTVWVKSCSLQNSYV
jgi:hypothetical protein